MMQKFLASPKFVLGLLFVVLLLHIFAISFHWYAILPWFDSVHHFLGGFWVASLYLYLSRVYPRLAQLPDSAFGAFIAVSAFAALTGVLWEFYEFGFDFVLDRYGIPFRAQADIVDTMTDLVFDLAGSVAFVIFFFSGRRRV